MIGEKFWHVWKGMGLNVLSIRQFVVERNIAILEQPPYSPVFSLCDFFLFPKLSMNIKGIRYKSVEAIQRAVTTELRFTPEESLHQCIEEWEGKMGKNIRPERDYFDGETMKFVVWEWYKLFVIPATLLFRHTSQV